jgi:hypothetical protein
LQTFFIDNLGYLVQFMNLLLIQGQIIPVQY